MNKPKPRPGRGIPDLTRLNFGLTQQQFADSLGVSRSVVAMMETGKRALPAHAKVLLAGLPWRMDDLPGKAPVVKRGRKPAGFTPLSLTQSVVTKLAPAMDTLQKLAKSKKARHWREKDASLQDHHQWTVKCLRKDNKCEEAVKEMQHARSSAQLHLELLWFRRNNAAVNHARFYAKLKGAEAALAGGVEILKTLPDGPAAKQWKVQNAYSALQKLRMEQKLKTYDHLSMLEMELQIGMLERGIELAGQYAAELGGMG